MKAFAKFVSLVLAVLLVTGCFPKEKAEPPTGERPPVEVPTEQLPMRSDGSRVERHAWDLLTRMDGEESGFGMYTYVLFARRADQSGLPPEVAQRYEQILQAIAGTTLNLPELGDMTPQEKEETNLLYVPGLALEKGLTPANYNSTLALRYLAELGRLFRVPHPQLAERLEGQPGPFLISLLQPVGQIGSEPVPMLYADLSTTNPAAMGEVVAAYKVRIVGDGMSTDARFASLRLKLLNLILDADDNLRLVKVALADWLPQ